MNYFSTSSKDDDYVRVDDSMLQEGGDDSLDTEQKESLISPLLNRIEIVKDRLMDTIENKIYDAHHGEDE